VDSFWASQKPCQNPLRQWAMCFKRLQIGEIKETKKSCNLRRVMTKMLKINNFHTFLSDGTMPVQAIERPIAQAEPSALVY
jgi:hypothetical protein